MPLKLQKLFNSFPVNAFICNPWKHQKTFDFQEVQMETLARNGLTWTHCYLKSNWYQDSNWYSRNLKPIGSRYTSYLKSDWFKAFELLQVWLVKIFKLLEVWLVQGIRATWSLIGSRYLSYLKSDWFKVFELPISCHGNASWTNSLTIFTKTFFEIQPARGIRFDIWLF